jgi:hypothetical protein
MRNKVLYFPYINVPNSSWFTRILLYWDEIGTIMPYEFIDDPSKLDPYTRDLVHACLVKQIIPEKYFDELTTFNTLFKNYLCSLDKRILKERRKSFLENKCKSIHIGKMNGIQFDLREMKLGKVLNYPWWFVEKNTANEYMAFLAAALGNINELQFDPISDQITNLRHLIINTNTKKNESDYISKLRIEILSDLFPSPSGPIKVDKLRAFKEANYDDLKLFRNRIEKEIISIADTNDPTLRQRRLELFKEESTDAVKKITSIMYKKGWRSISLTKFGAALCLIPGVSWVLGLPSALDDTLRRTELSRIDSSFIYAAAVQKEKLT